MPNLKETLSTHCSDRLSKEMEVKIETGLHGVKN